MRPRDLLPYSIATLIWCAASFSAHHFPIGGWASSPVHGGNHESRATGSLQSTSDAARYWKIPQDAQGTVMCAYRLLANNRAAPDRLDVRFTPQLVIWGGAAEDFEEIRDIPERTMQ